MNPTRWAEFLASMGQSGPRVADFVSAAAVDPKIAAALSAAVEAGDNRAAIRLMADQQWGRAPLRDAPGAPAPTTGRSPMSLEDRVLGDPNIRRAIEESGGAYPAGDPEAIMAAFRGSAPRRGRPRRVSTEDSIRELIPPADVPTRQMELPMGEESRGLIPYGTRGPGVPHGGLMGPGTLFDSGARGMVPAPMRGLPAPGPTGMVPMGERGLVPVPDVVIPRQYRVVDEAPQTGGLGQLAGAAAAGLGVAAGVKMGLDALGPTQPEATADLVQETRPAPEVQAALAPPAAPAIAAPPDYSAQARELIKQLNDMRRAAGGEVPEAPAMMRQINELLAQSNAQRNAPEFTPQNDGDPCNRALSMLKELNAKREAAGGEVPESQQMMQEITRLQEECDEIRNAPRPGGRPAAMMRGPGM